MATEPAAPASPGNCTVIVSRHIKEGRETEFEQSMHAFIQYAIACPGHTAISVYRPAGDGRDYTVIDRFVDEAARKQFEAAAEYQQWMARLGELTEGAPRVREQNALDEWLRPDAAPSATTPPRYKTACATFLGVFPVALALNVWLSPVIRGWPPVLAVAVSSALMVALLAWGVMPVISQLLRTWLYPTAT